MKEAILFGTLKYIDAKKKYYKFLKKSRFLFTLIDLFLALRVESRMKRLYSKKRDYEYKGRKRLVTGDIGG